MIILCTDPLRFTIFMLFYYQSLTLNFFFSDFWFVGAGFFCLFILLASFVEF